MRWAEHVARLGEKGSGYKVLVQNPEGKRRLGTRWLECEGNIKMDLEEMRSEGVDWIHVAVDRGNMWAVVDTVTYLRVS
jgi:hypothetical protein